MSGEKPRFRSRNPKRQDWQKGRVPCKEALISTAAVDFLPSESRFTKEQEEIKSKERKLKKRKIGRTQCSWIFGPCQVHDSYHKLVKN